MYFNKKSEAISPKELNENFEEHNENDSSIVEVENSFVLKSKDFYFALFAPVEFFYSSLQKAERIL